MSFLGYKYKAFGEDGEYERQAQVVHELPTPELRMRAIAKARVILCCEVSFGVELGISNGLTPSQIDNDETGLMARRGADLPLFLFD